MKLHQFAAMRGFESARAVAGTVLIDHLAEGNQGGELRANFLNKRIQFDTNAMLFEELEKVCSMLDCSKREFLEIVVSEACANAQAVFAESFEEAGGVDHLEAQAC